MVLAHLNCFKKFPMFCTIIFAAGFNSEFLMTDDDLLCC